MGSYEEKYKRLENIVRELESDSLSLDESITKYEEGVRLYRECEEMLKKYEGKIKVLMEKDGNVKEVDYNGL